MNLEGKASKLAAIGAVVISALVAAGCSSSPSGAEPDGAESGAEPDGAEAVTMSVGRQPFAAGNSPITQYMINNSLVEEAAAELGYDLTVDWQDFPSAAPMVEAMVADRLDFGMWGNTPIIRAAAQDQPVSAIAVGEGHFRLVLATRTGNEITDIADLEGKTVGVLVGTDSHLALLQMLEAELGTSDVAALGINLVNLPSPASAAQVPDGVDATVANYNLFLAEQSENDQIVAIANSFGQTEGGYEGELGEGAGIDYPSAEDSNFAPEGFYAHRSFWVARDAFIEEYPDLIVAFNVALQEAITDLGEGTDEEAAALVEEYWGDPSVSSAVIADELLFDRGWAWATNGDAQVLMKLSQTLADAGTIDSPLDWEETVGFFQPAAAAVGQAYEAAGGVPDRSVFDTNGETDTRGAPQWDVDAWVAP